LHKLKEGKSVEIPTYCFKTHSRLPQTTTSYGADVVILEGILILHNRELRDLMDMKLFVDSDGDTRLARRRKSERQELSCNPSSFLLSSQRYQRERQKH